LRAAAVALAVGQALGCAGARGPEGPPVSETPSPPLVVPPLDAGADARAAADGVLFGHPPAAVGAAFVVSVNAVSSSPDPQGGIQISTYDSEVKVEVLAVDGPAPSRVRLHFERNTRTFQEKETPTSLHGKTFLVDARAPHVRDEAGAPVAEEDTQKVLDVFPDLGTRARIDEVLPDEAMRIGEGRDDLAVAILRVIHPRAWTLRSGSAVLARTEAGHAVFAVKLDASSAGGLHMVVAGEARVRLRDARLSDLALEGTYEEPKAGTPSTTPPEPARPGSFRLRRSVRDGR